MTGFAAGAQSRSDTSPLSSLSLSIAEETTESGSTSLSEQKAEQCANPNVSLFQE